MLQAYEIETIFLSSIEKSHQFTIVYKKVNTCKISPMEYKKGQSMLIGTSCYR